MKILALVPLLMGVTACYSQKNISTTPTPAIQSEQPVTPAPEIVLKEPITNFEVNTNGNKMPGNLNWEHFSGRYDIDIDLGEGQEYNGVMSFRMKRDSLFWFSISASIGFQIAKGIIKNDTLHALDLLQKNYYRIPLKELQNSTQLPAQIGALQRLFSGEILSQLIYYNNADSTFRGDASFYPGYRGKFDNANRVTQNAISDELNQRYLWADYSGRLKTENPQYSVASQTRIILKDALKTIRLDVRLKTSSFEPIPSYPFNVPNGYTLVEIW